MSESLKFENSRIVLKDKQSNPGDCSHPVTK